MRCCNTTNPITREEFLRMGTAKEENKFAKETVVLSYEFKMSCGHYLRDQGGKCVNIHGHNYKVVVTLSGCPDPKTNMLIDTYELKEIFKQFVDDVHDHKILNETMFTENPTMEFMAYFIYWQLKPVLPMLWGITVFETDEGSATYAGS